MDGAFFVRIGRTNPTPRSFPGETTRNRPIQDRKNMRSRKGMRRKAATSSPSKKKCK